MTKWLNPDATTADLGVGMQAYYDEDKKYGSSQGRPS
jgi:hypothetical protein